MPSLFTLTESEVRAEKDHGKRFKGKVASSFIGIVHKPQHYFDKCMRVMNHGYTIRRAILDQK